MNAPTTTVTPDRSRSDRSPSDRPLSGRPLSGRPLSGRPLSSAVYAAMDRAARSLGEAAQAVDRPGDRYVSAHVAALQVTAAVLAARAKPVGRGRVLNAWVLLERVAPELGEWATYFAAGARVRSAVEAGLDHAVSQRAADDLLRGAEQYFNEVADRFGLTPSLLLATGDAAAEQLPHAS